MSLAKVSDWNSFRVNQNYSDIYIRANANNHSEPIRKTFCISFDEKRSEIIRLNPINSKTSIQMNPNQSEIKFSIRIYLNESKARMIRIDSDWKIGLNQSEPDWSDWSGLKTWFGIDVSELIGLSRIDFWPFFIKQDIFARGYNLIVIIYCIIR